MRRTQFLLATGLFCCIAFAQSGKPDFSGTWKLNNGKSTQDGPADRVYLCTISQAKASVTVNTKSEGVTNLLDGTFPITEKFRIEKQGNLYRYTRVYWEGATLVFEIKDQGRQEGNRQGLLLRAGILDPQSRWQGHHRVAAYHPGAGCRRPEAHHRRPEVRLRQTVRYMRRRTRSALALAVAVAATGWAQTADCNAPAPAPSVSVAVPTSPFAVTPTSDGCWLFVSGIGGGGGESGIAVLRRESGHIALASHGASRGSRDGNGSDSRREAVGGGVNLRRLSGCRAVDLGRGQGARRLVARRLGQ